MSILQNEILAGQNVMLFGPPGCIAGDTIVFDPVANTNLPISTRFKSGEPFHVLARHNDSFVVANALPPVKYAPQPMFCIRFKSGFSLRVTGEHRLWDGVSYSTPALLLRRLESGHVHLPSISDIYPLAHAQDDVRCLQTKPDLTGNCQTSPCSDGGQLLPSLTTCQSVSPSQADAPTHNQLWLHVGDLEDAQANILVASHGHLSTMDCEYQIAPLIASESQCDWREVRPVLSADLISSLSQLNQQIALSDTVQSPSHGAFLSNDLLNNSCHYTIGGAKEEQDEIESISACGSEVYYDFHVPVFNNYFADGFWHHNCGKTARILAAAAAAGYKVIVWRASLMERVDVSGCIVPDMATGTSSQLPFADVFFLRTTTEKYILFIDDLGQAPTDVQAAIMRLFDNGFFPANVLIWAASNRPGDKAGVNALCEPLRSRFHSAYCIPTPDSAADKPDGGVMLGTWADEVANWVEWAMDNNAPAEIIAWHRSTAGKSLYQWKPSADPSIRMADFRSWGCLIGRWNSGLRSLSQVAAVLGKPAAAEFLAFASLADKLPSPDEVWMSPDTAPVPSDVSAQWLIITSLSAQVTQSTVPAYLRYVCRFERVMTALGARDVFRRLGAKLTGCREWVAWFTENQALFTASK